MDLPPATPTADLDWSNVGIGLCFVALNLLLSQTLQLHISAPLGIAALRCTVQLTFVATVLQHVFASKKWWVVTLIALLLNILGTFETVVIKASRRCRNMFAHVLIAMLVANIPVSILGVRFAMGVTTFWTPEQYIPVVGMLCGNAIACIAVSQRHILKELDENRDKTETLLAFGASRFEACRPLAVEGLRMALMPTINQMSVIGIISIPGMMTGAILGGANVQQAARLQMIIMFMITASSALSCIISTYLALSVCVDSEHRVRGDCIDTRPLTFRRVCSGIIWAAVGFARRTWNLLRGLTKREEVMANGGIHNGHIRSERTPLLV
ncbi:hypothetical protein F5148DRAFT_981553 [Russula earlei]|uniref:Uncharacterized protein n=1 Tax=Russula earlei TaxID=71964 RepID=A0ACC0U818_9AGAM|nr:hypothetical protein F5148DRAFT_981553 [Russula earlei]